MITEFTEKNFKDIEKKLRIYYENLKTIESLEYKCKVLEEQKDSIFKDIKDINVTIDAELGMGVEIAERVQTSPKWGGSAENKIVNQVERLHEEWKKIRKEVLELRHQIRKLKMSNLNLGTILYNKLNEDEKRFVKLKYGSGKDVPNRQLASEMHMGETSVRRKKKKMAALIYKELIKSGEISAEL